MIHESATDQRRVPLVGSRRHDADLFRSERKLLIHGGLFIARETTVSRSLISQMNRTQELAIVSKKRDEIVAHRVKQTKPPVISVIRFL